MFEWPVAQGGLFASAAITACRQIIPYARQRTEQMAYSAHIQSPSGDFQRYLQEEIYGCGGMFSAELTPQIWLESIQERINDYLTESN